MSQKLDLSKPHRRIHVGVILMGGTTEILDVAPVDLINGLAKGFIDEMPDDFISAELKAQAIDADFHWVSEAGPGTPSKLTGGISLNPTDSFTTCPPLDIVIMGAHNYLYRPNETELAFVRKAHDDCTAFLAICGGVQVPLAAGLLVGTKATGPRLMLDVLRQQAPQTEWLERRYVHDGKIWTTGALLNGNDMMRTFATEVWGAKGDASLVGFLTKVGAWPNREIEYKDVPWAM